nr:uncharacterized protein LOC129444656 isoform X1 [Misgurnus anguillicaudatus]
MGRYKKGKKLVRADMWAKAGGIDAVAEELMKADICNENTEYSSEIWSQLSKTLFHEDNPKNRLWLWVTWTQNRQGLRDRINMATGESNVITPILPNPVKQDMEPQKQVMPHSVCFIEPPEVLWNPDEDPSAVDEDEKIVSVYSRRPDDTEPTGTGNTGDKTDENVKNLHKRYLLKQMDLLDMNMEYKRLKIRKLELEIKTLEKDATSTFK